MLIVAILVGVILVVGGIWLLTNDEGYSPPRNVEVPATDEEILLLEREGFIEVPVIAPVTEPAEEVAVVAPTPVAEKPKRARKPAAKKATTAKTKAAK